MLDPKNIRFHQEMGAAALGAAVVINAVWTMAAQRTVVGPRPHVGPKEQDIATAQLILLHYAWAKVYGEIQRELAELIAVTSSMDSALGGVSPYHAAYIESIQKLRTLLYPKLTLPKEPGEKET